MPLRTILRYRETIRHLKPGQPWARLRERRYRLLRSLRPPTPWETMAEGWEPDEPDDGLRRRLDAIIAWRGNHWPDSRGWSPENPGRYTFLSQDLETGFPPRWIHPAPPRTLRDPALWLFHLHYWDWIWPLDPGGEDAGLLKQAVDSWLDACPLGIWGCFRGPASAYTVSRRLPNWLLLWSSLPPAQRPQRMAAAIAGQGRWLLRHLEWEHRGNHLLENLYALLFLSLFLPGARGDALRSEVEPLFRAQLREQILPGGLHGEGSPMYHALVLDRLLDLLALHEGWTHVEEMRDAAVRMTEFLSQILPTSRALPPLGDTAAGMVPDPDRIGERAANILQRDFVQEPRATVLRDGHWVWRDNTRGHFLLFDAGPGGLPWCGAHQKADLLHFELHFDGLPCITACGTANYKDSRTRRRSRSAREHASLMVDGQACSDPWRSFRLGRRGSTEVLSAGETSIAAEHDGFRHLRLIHRREIQVEPDGPVVTVIDRLRSCDGRRRRCRAALRFPLAPKLAVEAGPSEVLIREEDSGSPVARMTLEWDGPGSPAAGVEEGFFFPAFGLALQRVVVVWEKVVWTDAEIRTTIRPALRPEMPGKEPCRTP